MGKETALRFAAGSVFAVPLLADQTAKAAVKKKLQPGEEKYLSPKTGRYVVVNHVRNYGMAGNMGDKEPEKVRGISAVMTAAAAAALVMTDAERKAASGKDRKIRPLLPVREAGLSLLLSGAVSNTLDRVKDGYVTDYISFRTGVPVADRYSFNIADFAILTGAVISAATVGSGRKTVGEIGKGAAGAAASVLLKKNLRKKKHR